MTRRAAVSHTTFPDKKTAPGACNDVKMRVVRAEVLNVSRVSVLDVALELKLWPATLWLASSTIVLGRGEPQAAWNAGCTLARLKCR